MGQEIERKFLVTGDGWRRGAVGVRVRQGYLSLVRERVVRVRLQGESGFLTVKGVASGPVRPEFEYPIPARDARALLGLCQGRIIEKTRYEVPHAGLVWEVDEFHGADRGLVLAECELTRPDQVVTPPDWLGEEVTGDPRYYNSSLVENPFAAW